MDMNMDSSISKIMEGVVDAVKMVVPFSVDFQPHVPVQASLFQSEIGVLVGITGAVRGRLIIEAPKLIFSYVSSALYGMELDGEMLESFVGEFGNMMGGSICTSASQKGLMLDITPPTVLVGHTKLTGLGSGLCAPVSIPDHGVINISLVLEDATE